MKSDKSGSAIINLAYGVVIGSSMMLPGVSGGTMAIILGIYDQLISAVSNIFKQFKKSMMMLIPVGAGAGVGIIFLAKLLLDLVNSYRMPMHYLFIGFILGSVPLLYKKARVSGFSISAVLSVLAGLCLSFLVGRIPKATFQLDSDSFAQYALLFVAGILLAVALILPGISASYMLFILGLYEPVLSAINNWQLVFLAVLACGVLLGTLLTTKALEALMQKHPEGTYLLIIGFVLASLREVFPGIPSMGGLPLCLLMLLIGFIVIFIVSSKAKEA